MRYLSLLLFLAGCGDSSGWVGHNNSCIHGCSGDNGPIVIVSPSVIPGPPGPAGSPGADGTNGTNGINGTNGYTTLVEMVNTSTCENGGYTIITALDVNGDGVIDTGDANVQSAQICNGTNGTNGLNAPPTQYTPVTILDPCNDPETQNSEVFLKLENGTVLADFSANANGYDTRLSVLPPGTYDTTDGFNCVFTLDSNGNFTYQSHVDQ